MQFVVRRNWLNSVKTVCSLSVCGHHSYHLNLLTYVVLFRSFLLNPVHRCCQDFPLYLRAGFGSAPRGARGWAPGWERARAGGCEEQRGTSCQRCCGSWRGSAGSSAAVGRHKRRNFSRAGVLAEGQGRGSSSSHGCWVRSHGMKGGTATTFKQINDTIFYGVWMCIRSAT